MFSSVFSSINNVQGQNPFDDFKKSELLYQNSLVSKEDVANSILEGTGVNEFKKAVLKLTYLSALVS